MANPASNPSFTPAPQQALPYAFVPCAQLAGHVKHMEPASLRLVADSFVQELQRAGWTQLPAEANSGRRLTRGGHIWSVDKTLMDLACGNLTEQSWISGCSAGGFAQMNVAVPIRSTASFQPPSTKQSNRKLWLVLLGCFAGILVVGFATGSIWIHTYTISDDHLANHRGTSGEVEVPVDGKSNLPGGLATMTYRPAPHEFESVTRVANPNDPLDGESWAVNRRKPHGRSYIGMQHNVWQPVLDSQAQINRWLGVKNNEYANWAGHSVSYKKGRFAGHTAYIWEFVENDGSWRRGIWVLSATNSFGFFCRAWHEDDVAAFKQQCDAALATAKIARGATSTS